MKYPELIAQVAKQQDMKPKDVRAILDATMTVVADALAKDEPVNLRGVGRLVVWERPEEKVTDPKTGKTKVVPATRRIVVRQPKTEAAQD